MAQGTDRLAALVTAEARLDRLYELLDRASAEVRLAGGKPAEGCDGCCAARTPVAMRIEAVNVCSSVGRLGRGVAPLREEALDWLTHPTKGLTLRGLRANNDSAYQAQLLEQVKVASRLPCPFRDPGGPCRLHAARSLACRAHNVTMVGAETNAFIGRDAPLGKAIAEAYRALRAHLEDSDPSLLNTSFLPAHLARELAPSHLNGASGRDGTIAHAKLFTFRRPIDLFMGQP